MSTPYSSIAVANEFLSLAHEQGVKISPLQLMKLVYFAEGWHLGFFGKPLVQDEFQAWKFGPVSPTLYRETRDYGADAVDSLIEDPFCFDEDSKYSKCSVDDIESKNLIKSVWNAYKDVPPIKLSNMTHQPETPWRKIYDKNHGSIPRFTEIPKDEIKAYFETLVENTKK